MVSYRHWSVLLWWDPNDVPHGRILPSYEAEWWSVPAPLCWWCCYCLADQLWVLIAYARRRSEHIYHSNAKAPHVRCDTEALTVWVRNHSFRLSNQNNGKHSKWRNDQKKSYKKDGYCQRNMCQFLHILPSPGYAPGTIAVNVTWMERGFDAGQRHRSIYPSVFNRLRAIARYWSEIATFSYPLAFSAPVGGFPIGIPGKSLVLRKLESWCYQAVKTVWR